VFSSWIRWRHIYEVRGERFPFQAAVEALTEKFVEAAGLVIEDGDGAIG